MAEVSGVRESDITTSKGLDVGETLRFEQPLENSFGTFDTVTDFSEGCTPADILARGDIVMFRTVNSFVPRFEPNLGSEVVPNRPLSESVTEVVLGRTPEDLDIDDEDSGKRGEYLLYERTLREVVNPPVDADDYPQPEQDSVEAAKPTRTEVEEKYTFLDRSELEGAVVQVNNKLTMFAPSRERERQITLKGRVESVKALHRVAPKQD